MKYKEFVRKMAYKSRETERPLSQKDIMIFFNLFEDALMDLFLEDDYLIVKDFIHFRTKEQRGRKLTDLHTGEKKETEDKTVAVVKFSPCFKDRFEEAYVNREDKTEVKKRLENFYDLYQEK